MKMGYAKCIFLIKWFTIANVVFAQPFHDETKVDIQKLENGQIYFQEQYETSAHQSSTKKIQLKVYPNALDQNASLLLYLEEPANTVHFSVIDMVGNSKNASVYNSLQSGFYEITLHPGYTSKGIFKIKLIVDETVFYQQIAR